MQILSVNGLLVEIAFLNTEEPYLSYGSFHLKNLSGSPIMVKAGSVKVITGHSAITPDQVYVYHIDEERELYDHCINLEAGTEAFIDISFPRIPAYAGRKSVNVLFQCGGKDYPADSECSITVRLPRR